MEKLVARAFVQLWVTTNTPLFTDLFRNNGIAKYNLLGVKQGHIEAGHQQVSMVHWALELHILCLQSEKSD